jgi:dipeptidyl aminopeptidase/acylaminoacyl peptidase
MTSLVMDLKEVTQLLNETEFSWAEEMVPIEIKSRLAKFALFVACALWAITVPHTTMAQAAKPLLVEDDLRTLEFGELMPVGLSPDGKWLAYTVKNNQRSRRVSLDTWARSGIRDVFTGTDIYILNVETGVSKSLTSGNGDNFMPVWSPDGRYLAFLSDRDGSQQLKLWVWDLARREVKKVSDLNIRQFGQIEWSSDAQRLIAPVFPANISVEDYVKKLTANFESESASTDGKVPGSTVILYQPNSDGAAGDQTGKSDPWNLNVYLRDLASIDVTSGRATVIVRGQRIAKFLVSADGSRIAYTVPKRFEKPGSQQILFDLVMRTLSTGEDQVVASEIRLNYDGTPFSWSPDGRHLVYRTYGVGESTNDCYVVGVSGENERNITAMPAHQQWPKSAPLWDAKGEKVFFVSSGALWVAGIDQSKAVEVGRIPGRQITHIIPKSRNLLWTPDGGTSTIVLTHDDLGKQDGFYKVDLITGKSVKLLENGHCYTCENAAASQYTAVSGDQQHIFYFAEDAEEDSDLWTSDSQFRDRRRLTHLNSQFDKYKMGRARLINWLSDDGERINGALLLPADYQEGSQYPLIVWVYGGSSRSNDFDHFGLEGSGPFNMQLFATRGYAVLVPDIPQQLGTPMADLAKTVLPGVNKLIEMGIADPNRLGLMGHSYGGYSTLGLIVQTKRFKAAMEADGMADLIGQYGQMAKSGAAFGTSLTEQGQGLLGGTPWQFLSRYIENSPIFYLDRVETPLMIVHGSEDIVVAPFLGDELFVGLRRLGKKVEYARYEGEEHGPSYWSYANQVDLCNRMIVWFDRYLKGSAQ